MKIIMAGCVAGLMLAMLMHAQWACADTSPSNVLFLTNIDKMQLGMPIDTNPPPLPPGFTPGNSFWEPRPVVFHGADYTNSLACMLHRYMAPPGTSGIVVRFASTDLEPGRDYVVLRGLRPQNVHYPHGYYEAVGRYTGCNTSGFYSILCTGSCVEVWVLSDANVCGDVYGGLAIEGFYCWMPGTTSRRQTTTSLSGLAKRANDQRPSQQTATGAARAVRDTSVNGRLKASRDTSVNGWLKASLCCISNPVLINLSYSWANKLTIWWDFYGRHDSENTASLAVKYTRRNASTNLTHLYSSTGIYNITVAARSPNQSASLRLDVAVCATQVAPWWAIFDLSYEPAIPAANGTIPQRCQVKGYKVKLSKSLMESSGVFLADDGRVAAAKLEWGDGSVQEYGADEMVSPNGIIFSVPVQHEFRRQVGDRHVNWAGCYGLAATATDDAGLQYSSCDRFMLRWYNLCWTRNVTPIASSFKSSVSGQICRVYVDTNKPLTKQFRDKDGEVVDCFWRFTLEDKTTPVPGSLPQYRGMEATCMLPGPGRYCAILRAIDNLGACSDKVKKITVK